MIDQMKITVIATGFDETRARLSNIVNRNRIQQPQMTGLFLKKASCSNSRTEPYNLLKKKKQFWIPIGVGHPAF